ncbi:hypothetical protein FQN60_011520 [Etheostoma spectabile]|uniref:Uncharacterized protein n=1 Tax=Etheostoma spectabile TaxID=54343 RepID=A0A5J5CEA4_9PERO|nr:hypothetical protein FQN60_011520 [Etheostoma spectabile]
MEKRRPMKGKGPHLQLWDIGPSPPLCPWRRERRVRSQQSPVHGEGAAEQRGVPAGGLPVRREFVHRRPAGGPPELHPVQQQREIDDDVVEWY